MTILTYRDYLEKYNDCQILIQLWNDEYKKIYPISKELFERNVSNINVDLSFVVINNNEVVGFILAKTWEDDFPLASYQDTGWISLFYVKKQFRNQGIGSKLLDLVETEMIKQHKNILYLGKDYNNYFPGLPVDLKSNLEFFLKRGFERPYDTYDLIRNEKDYLTPKQDKYSFRLANINDKENILSLLRTNWPGRWLKEAIDYFDNGGTGREYLICLDGEKVIGFAKVNFPNTDTKLISYNLTWRNRFKALGGIGPLGIDKNYRKQNLGYDIVANACNILTENSVSEIIIDWTGLLEFYRHFDFEVWKTYFYLNKNLKGEKNA